MGIADVHKALREAAGDQIHVKDVKLGYKEGGKFQFLSFVASHNSTTPKFTNEKREITFDGTVNPIEQARKEGELLAKELQEN